MAFGRIDCRQFQLDEAGFIDAEHDREVRSHFLTITGTVIRNSLEPKNSSNVYAIAPRVANRALDKIHFWVPTGPELTALVEAINSRAGSRVISTAIAEQLLLRKNRGRGN